MKNGKSGKRKSEGFTWEKVSERTVEVYMKNK